MEQEQEGGRGEEEDGKWVTHYSSDHQILLVGEGDFSFSLSLAHSFGSASNIVASSLDSYDDVNKKYKQAKSNLDELQKLGACLLFGVDATKMKFHSDLKMRRFDRVIFNFPHAGFHGKEDNLAVIKMHKNLVLGFFKNASHMLRANGEIHVNHKTNTTFNKWNLEELAMQSFMTLIELADFKKEDYPGYNNKRGDGNRCDEPFPLGKCSTFKFIHNPRAMVKKPKRRKRKGSRKQTSLVSFHGIQDDVPQLPPATSSVGLSSYHHHQHHHVLKFNESVASQYSLSNEYTPISILNHYLWHSLLGVYLSHGTTMTLGSQRLLQPLQSMEPTSINVRYAETDHVRTMDNLHLPLGPRNDGYQVYNGSSNYLQESQGGGTSQNSNDRIVRPEFDNHIFEKHWRDLNGAKHGP